MINSINSVLSWIKVTLGISKYVDVIIILKNGKSVAIGTSERSAIAYLEKRGINYNDNEWSHSIWKVRSPVTIENYNKMVDSVDKHWKDK